MFMKMYDEKKKDAETNKSNQIKYITFHYRTSWYIVSLEPEGRYLIYPIYTELMLFCL